MNKGKYCKFACINISNISIKIRKGPPSLQEREIMSQTLKNISKMQAHSFLHCAGGPALDLTLTLRSRTKGSDQIFKCRVLFF